MTLVMGRIAHYQIIRKIGAGGMGEVYLAEDVRLGRKVALKLLSPEVTNDQHRVLRFKQEARAASALNHPNILTIYDIGEEDSTHFIATEFIRGETLRQRLSVGKIQVLEAIDIASQVATALAAAHEAAIVHRDIKPENIMLRPDGYVKVLDFGLAKLIERTTPSTESEPAISALITTEAGIIVGTPQYMSPEQIRGLDVDGRSDIFSLGAVIFEMISGRAAFQAATAGDVMAAILQSEPPLLAQYSMDIPVELQAIVTKALRKGREERYQSVRELLAELRSTRAKQESDVRTLPLWGNDAPRAVRTPQRVAAQTPQQVITPTGAAPANTASGPLSLVGRVRHYRLSALLVFVVVIILIGTALVIYRSRRTSRTASDAVTSAASPESITHHKQYSTMTESERLEFVSQRAQEISAMLGERPTALNESAVHSIREYVDRYAARSDSLSEKLWAEGLRAVFGRASQYAPVIVRSFKDRGVPPIIGLYLPMIESEYRGCLESPIGAKGLYQFMPETAATYGLNPSDRCDIEKIAPAASEYIADRIAEFGSDSLSMTLVILSFYRSPDAIRRDMRLLRRQNPGIERSFWSLLNNASKLDRYFQEDAARYVPRFFAAAIVGENPDAFGLRIQPLSQHY